MKIVDYSPVARPSLDQQRDAPQKGQGRAMQWSLAGKSDEGSLLEACLQDKRQGTASMRKHTGIAFVDQSTATRRL
jgi:hypothetical protein